MEEIIISYCAKGIEILGIIFLMRIPFDIVVDAFRGDR